MDEAVVNLLRGMYADLGLSTRERFAGGLARVAGRVVVEAFVLFLSWLVLLEREVLEALEMESRRRWNLRFVVAKAVGMVNG